MGLLVLAGEQKLTGTYPDGVTINDYGDWVEKRLRAMAVKQGVTLPPQGVVSGEPYPAVVDANRWIVHCPVCNGAEFAWKTSPFFMCATCWNGGNDVPHTWREVLFPENTAAIEKVLMARPAPSARNWTPVETLDDLIAENTAHGLKGGD